MHAKLMEQCDIELIEQAPVKILFVKFYKTGFSSPLDSPFSRWGVVEIFDSSGASIANELGKSDGWFFLRSRKKGKMFDTIFNQMLQNVGSARKGKIGEAKLGRNLKSQL